MEIDDKLACQIHGIGAISSDSDSDYDGKAEFDEEYYRLKPPPIDYNSHKDKIIVKNVSTSLDYEQEPTNSSVSNSTGKEIGSIIPIKHKKRKRSKKTLENVTITSSTQTLNSVELKTTANEQRTSNSPNVNDYDAATLKKAEENLDKILQSGAIQKNGHTSINKGVEDNRDIEMYEHWMKIVLAAENALEDKENCKSNSNALKSNTKQDLSESKGPSADPSTNGTTKKKKRKFRSFSSVDLLEDATVVANVKNASIASNNMNKGITNTVEIKDTLSLMSLKSKQSTETKISQEIGGKLGSKLLDEQTMRHISKSNTNAMKSNTEQDPSGSKTQFANPLTSGTTNKKIKAFSSVDLAEDVTMVANIENASKAYILPINTVDLRNNIDKVVTNSVEIKDTLYVRSLKKNMSQKSTQENIERLRSKLLHEETMGHIWQLPQNIDTRLLSQSVTGIKSSLVATGPKTKANKKQKQSVATKSKTKKDKTQTQSFAAVLKTKQKQPGTNGAIPKAIPNTQVAPQTKVQKPVQMQNVQKQSVAAASKANQKQPGTNGAVPKAKSNKKVASQTKVQKPVQNQSIAAASKTKKKQPGTKGVIPKANPNIQVTPQSKVQIPVQMQNVQNNGIVNSNYPTYVSYNNTNLPLQIPLNFNRGPFQNPGPNIVLRVPHAPPNAHCSAEQLFIENVQRQMVYNNRYGPNLTPDYCNQRPVPQFTNPNNPPIPQNWNFPNYGNPQNHFNAPLPNYFSNNNAANGGFVDRNISCTVTELSYRNVNSTDRGVVNETTITAGFNLSQNGTMRNDQLQLENTENVNISNETRIQSLGGPGESDRLLSALEISNGSLKSNESEKNLVASFSTTESEVYPTDSDRYIAARSVECKIQACSHSTGANDDLGQHYEQLIVKSKPKLDYFCDNKSSVNYRSPVKRKSPRYDRKKIFYFKMTILFPYVIILSVLLMNLANAVTIFLQDNILSIFGILLCFICVKVINFLEAL